MLSGVPVFRIRLLKIWGQGGKTGEKREKERMKKRGKDEVEKLEK